MAQKKPELRQLLESLKPNQMLVWVDGRPTVETYRAGKVIRTLDAIAPSLHIRREVYAKLKGKDNTVRAGSMSYAQGMELDANGRAVTVTRPDSANYFRDNPAWKAAIAAEGAKRHTAGVTKGYQVVGKRRNAQGRFAPPMVNGTIAAEDE